jgi:hypothetical protein
MTEAISRRRMLVGAGGAAAAAGALVATAPRVGAQGNSRPAGRSKDDDGLVGTWLVVHTDDPSEDNPNPEPSTTTVSLIPGGVVVTHDVNPPGPPGQGAWERTDDAGGFVLTFVSSGQAPPEPGAGGGEPQIFVITVTVTGSLSDGTISGTFTFSGVDGTGAPLFSGTGSFTGTLMSATG